MQKVTLSQARAFALSRQLLSGNDLPSDHLGAHQVIERLGYVQIDTISVVERAHHHVFWSRLPGYRPDHLRILEEQDRKVFEYWAHAASYLPMRDYRYSLVKKNRIAAGEKFWSYEKDPESMQFILDRIRAEGPLMSRDFEKDQERQPREMWMQHPVNQALRELFMSGRLMTSHRRGFQKVLDLPERILPEETDQTPPTEEEYLAHLIDRDLTAHGLMKDREIGYLLRIDRKKLRKLLRRQVKSGELTEIKVETLEKDPYYARTELLENFLTQNRPQPDLFHILSPFDNLLIQRKRTEELFGFNYTLECYVPAGKRINGYFCLPMLYGDRFVGQIDLKADRKTGKLLVRNLVWEPGVRQKDIRRPFREKLADFAAFNGCGAVEG